MDRSVIDPHDLLARTLDGRGEADRQHLLRLAQLNGIRPEEAEDVVQETLLEAWRSLPNLHQPQRFVAWLDGICRNVCKRHLRVQAVTLQTSVPLTRSGRGDALTFDLADPQALDPIEELEREARQVLLDRALGYLEARPREVIELCYLAEVPKLEVAELLEMSPGALEVRLHRARRHLRQVLSGPLREDAIAFGLLSDSDEAMGWQEMRQWCWVCGKQRLRATFERQPTGLMAFRVRCPDCSARYDADSVNTGQVPLILPMNGATRSFRPALKRTLQACADVSAIIFKERACPICHARVQIDLIDGHALDTPSSTLGKLLPSIYLRVTCPTCPSYVCEFFSVLLMKQDVRTFLLDRSRVLVPPSRMDTYAGVPAIRSCLLDSTSGERITIMTHPSTFQVIATMLEA
jgi:RNA polymerase sigma factor (sigma-70 family)